MRVGIFVLAAGRSAGGPETYEVQLVRALARVDRENRYFVYCPAESAAEAIGPVPENFAFRVLRPAFRPFSIAVTLPRWAAADRLDCFHATYAPPPRPILPLVFTMHCASNFASPEFYPSLKRWRLNALQRVGLRHAGAILCVSDYVRRYVRDRFDIIPQRLATVYNGVDPQFFEGGETPVQGPYILYSGKLQARKNVVGLIRAYALYRRRTGSWARLVLAGKKVETSEGIDEAIRELDLEREVVQLGYIAPAQMPGLYAGARMTVFVSFHEGFGLPAVEAMAAGSPLVVSNVTSLPEIAGDAALVVDPYSVEEIAAAMERLDGDAGLRADLAERGRARARLFSWDNCACRTLDAYRRLCR